MYFVGCVSLRNIKAMFAPSKMFADLTDDAQELSFYDFTNWSPKFSITTFPGYKFKITRCWSSFFSVPSMNNIWSTDLIKSFQSTWYFLNSQVLLITLN